MRLDLKIRKPRKPRKLLTPAMILNQNNLRSRELRDSLVSLAQMTQMGRATTPQLKKKQFVMMSPGPSLLLGNLCAVVIITMCS